MNLASIIDPKTLRVDPRRVRVEPPGLLTLQKLLELHQVSVRVHERALSPGQGKHPWDWP